MKILIICNCSSGLLHFRGLLIKTLIEQGNIVSAVIPTSTEPAELVAEQGLKELGTKLLYVTMERRGMNPVKDLSLMWHYYSLVSREIPDLVITYTIKPNAYGGMVCRFLDIPYAANITGLGTAFQKPGMLRTFVTNLYKLALRRSKVVLFENVENRDVIVKAGIIPEKQTHVLPGAGVDLERFTYQPYPEDEGVVRFLFMGRVMSEKGIDELFTAMERLVSEGVKCTLDICGGFEEDYKDKIAAYEKAGWLHYHGVVSDVRPYIKNCHCFVLPSWHEGMANTNLESAASGRPVITTNIHGCLEAVEDGVTGLLCEKGSAGSLYEVMRVFCELLHKEKEEMGRLGRERMVRVFDKKLVVGETIEHIVFVM